MVPKGARHSGQHGGRVLDQRQTVSMMQFRQNWSCPQGRSRTSQGRSMQMAQSWSSSDSAARWDDQLGAGASGWCAGEGDG